MIKKLLLTGLLCSPSFIFPQTSITISPNGAGNTYEEFNAILAPIRGSGVEASDLYDSSSCASGSFDNGQSNDSERYIYESYDSGYGDYVYHFLLDLEHSSDKGDCSNNRQRTEIKSYNESPASLLGTLGETVQYKWDFKLPNNFDVSSNFTHIHQIKSVGGNSSEESIPMITLTAYDSSDGGRLYLRYSSQTEQENVDGVYVNLSDLENNWVEVTETITYGYEGNGSFSISIRDKSDGSTLMSYSDNSKRYYKTDADFMRPKWGIYRSTADEDALKDEEVLFGYFEITELDGIAPTFDNIPVANDYFIDTIIASPPTDDLTNEYFEFYGEPNAVIPSSLYFVMIEGDGEAGKTDMGKVKEAIQLGDGTRRFGSNGMLSIVANYNAFDGTTTTNPYATVISNEATVIEVELQGAMGYDVTSSASAAVSSASPNIGYDGNFGDASATYMLIDAASNPKNTDIDIDDDGNIDAAGEHTSWVLYDSVSYLDYDDPISATETGEYGYGQVIFARGYNDSPDDFKTTSSATIINQGNSNVSFLLRLKGDIAGYEYNDWIGASNSTGAAAPNWKFTTSSSKINFNEFLGYEMQDEIFGAPNDISFGIVLSNDNIELIQNNISIYPNPVVETLNINTNEQIDSIYIYDIAGNQIFNDFSGLKSINVSNLNSGMYILKIRIKNQEIIKKIIK